MAPADYLAVRDSCIERKKKKNGGKISDKGIADCKKIASIWYWKKHGKPVQHSDAREIGMDDIDLDILTEQLDVFGTLEEYEKWQNTLNIEETNDNENKD